MGKVVDLADAVECRARWKRLGLPVVVTNGCFDLLHLGHVEYLRAARAEGRRLIVGVNSDASTRRLKGTGRPIVPAAERAALLAALRPVDLVVVFDSDTAEGLVAALAPDVYVKGGDYGPGRKTPPEARVAAAVGARVVYVPLTEGRSTSALVDRIRRLP